MIKQIMFILLLIISSIGISQCLASDEAFDSNRSDATLEYGIGYKATLYYVNLTIGTIYILQVANNTEDAYNISWTSTNYNAKIDINYNGAQIDRNNNNLQSIQVQLINNGTQTVLNTIYIPLTHTGPEYFAESILVWLTNLTYIFIGLFVVIGLLALAKEFL